MYNKKSSYNSFHSRSNNFSMETLMPIEDVLAGAVADHNERTVKKQQLETNFYSDYKPADYQKAEKFRDDHSYVDKNQDGTHRQIEFLEDNVVFQKFGPGIYLYLELIRRLGWLLFVFSILEALIVGLNWKGTGLAEYSINFGNILIYSTLGNYNTEVTGFDVYIQTGAHCLICLLFFIFFIFWKIHNYSTIDDYQNGDQIVHPRRFCIEIQGLPPHGVSNRDLEIFFGNFGPVYESSIVYNYKDKLRFFYDVDEIDEKIKEEELELALGSGSEKTLRKLKKQKQDLANEINSIKIHPRILSAYIHFQYQESKKDMMDFYADHYSFSTLFHQCVMRGCLCCCIKQLPYDYRFNNAELKIKNPKVTDPEEINWDSFDISWTSKILRVVFAVFAILLFVVVCSTLVALCSIFIQTNAINCTGLTGYNITQVQTSGDPAIKTCFCNNQMFNFFDSSVQSFCKEIFKTLYIQNLLQIAAAVISSITNLIFGFVLGKIIRFTKPNNLSSALFAQTLIYFIFIFINSIVLPVIIYSDIYGVKPASYVSLIKLLIPNAQIFNMNNYEYYSDFSNLWYKNVSPFATNFLIIDSLILWVKFLVYICYLAYKKKSLQEDHGRILQKKMNQKIVSFEVDVVNETAYVFLVTFMCMIYFAGIPIIIPLGAFSIISRYIVNKYLIIRHSKRIQGLTESFNYLSVVILPFSVVFGCFVGIWMLTASLYIYPDKLKAEIPGTNQLHGSSPFFSRIFYISFTFVVGALVVLYIFFYNTVVRFCSWIFSCCCEKSENKVTPIKRAPVRFSDAVKTMNVSYSYNIHSNEKYKNAILNLERFLEIE